MCFNRKHAEQIYSKKKQKELSWMQEQDKSWFVCNINKKAAYRGFNFGKCSAITLSFVFGGNV